MNTRIGFSASKNTFYWMSDREVYISNGLWVDDIQEIAEGEWLTYCGEPPKGKIRGVNMNNKPCWVDIPTATPEQLELVHERDREALLVQADTQIRRYAVLAEFGGLSIEEEQKLMEWKKFMAEVHRKEFRMSTVNDWPSMPH